MTDDGGVRWDGRHGQPRPDSSTLPAMEPVTAERAARREAVTAVGGVGNLDPWDEPEPARRDLYDKTAWIERMIWRNAFLLMFVLGVVAYAFEWLTWIPALALAAGGLAPGLFLMAREQVERNVEADRLAMRPETRHDGTLPPLRRTVARESLDD
jgi:hypothetical protein